MTQPRPTPNPPPAGPGGVGPGVPDPGVRPTPNPQVPGQSPQTQPRTGGLAGAVTDALNPFTGLDDSLTAVRAWISDRHNWVRVSWVVGGVAMFVAGVLMIGGRTAGKAAGTVVQTVLPAGKAAKAVKKVT